MSKTLGEVFADLSYGPFSGMMIGDDGAGTIPAAQQSRVLALVNQGLTKLYSKFLIAERELTIRTIEGRLSYPLRAVHADSNSSFEFKFIADTMNDPFTGDMIRILLVLDEEGAEIPLNNYEEETSFFTPKPDVLQILDGESNRVFHILYQANHTKLLTADLSLDIDLPEPLHEALECYVGYKVLAPMNGSEHKMRADDLRANYEKICFDALEGDLGKYSSTTTSRKLEDRGFV